MNKKIFLVLITLAVALLLFGCTQSQPASQNAFKSVDNSICKIDGKPVIRMYSTNICPHCKWVGPTFDEVVKKYEAQGKIVAYHWEWVVDQPTRTVSDLLHPEVTQMPDTEQKIFEQFTPEGYVPTFVFGCKYYRIGNQFEQQNDLNAEKAVFEETIQKLLAGQ